MLKLHEEIIQKGAKIEEYQLRACRATMGWNLFEENLHRKINLKNRATMQYIMPQYRILKHRPTMRCIVAQWR
jgi:hypothetical protein